MPGSRVAPVAGMPTRDRYALAAAVLFTCGVIYAIAQLVLMRPYGRMDVDASMMLSAVLAGVWGAAAVTLGLRARRRVLRSSLVLGWLGTFLALGHGLVLNAMDDRSGLALMVASMLSAVLVKSAFTPYPWTEPVSR